VEILTASELGVNQFRMINNPIGFKTAMLNAKEGMGHNDRDDYSAQAQVAYEQSAGYRDVDPREVPEMISRLDQLRRQGAITEAEFQNKKNELLRKID
jgi:hypothetical protein